MVWPKCVGALDSRLRGNDKTRGLVRLTPPKFSLIRKILNVGFATPADLLPQVDSIWPKSWREFWEVIISRILRMMLFMRFMKPLQMVSCISRHEFVVDFGIWDNMNRLLLESFKGHQMPIFPLRNCAVFSKDLDSRSVYVAAIIFLERRELWRESIYNEMAIKPNLIRCGKYVPSS